MANPYQHARKILKEEKMLQCGYLNDLRPPNLYYNYGNARQTFQPSTGKETANRYIPLNPRPLAPQILHCQVLIRIRIRLALKM